MIWWRICLEHATFGIAVYDGKVVRAPPIARWAVGKDAFVVLRRYMNMGADVQCLGPL